MVGGGGAGLPEGVVFAASGLFLVVALADLLDNVAIMATQLGV